MSTTINYHGVIPAKLREQDISSKALTGLTALRAVWLSTTAATYAVPRRKLASIIRVQAGTAKGELGSIVIYVRKGMSLTDVSLRGKAASGRGQTVYKAKIRKAQGHKLITARRSSRSRLMQTVGKARTTRKREPVKGFQVKGHSAVFIRKRGATWVAGKRTPIIKLFRLPDAYLLNSKRILEKVKVRHHLKRMSKSV